jgi:hypothetical protein
MPAPPRRPPPARSDRARAPPAARRREEAPRRHDALRQADLVAGDDEQLHRHRLLDDDRHRVAVAVGRDDAGHRQHVRVLHRLDDLRRRPAAQQRHRGAALRDPPLERGPQRAIADDEHAHVAEARGGVDEHLEALLLDEPGDRQHAAPTGQRARAAKRAGIDAHHDLVDGGPGRERAQMDDVVVAAGEDERRALELLAQVARLGEDVVGVRGDAVGPARELREAQGVERGAGGEVGVQVLVAALEDLARGHREGPQRSHPLLAAPAPAPHEVARAGQRPVRGKPQQVAPRASGEVEELDVDVGGGLGVGGRRPPRGLHAHAVAHPPQRLQLVDDERLRELRPLIQDEDDAHRGSAAGALRPAETGLLSRRYRVHGQPTLVVRDRDRIRAVSWVFRRSASGDSLQGWGQQR